MLNGASYKCTALQSIGCMCAGHHMLPVAMACQDTATLDKLLAETTQLFEDHERDAADTIMLAFDKGTFTKVSVL